MLCLSNFTFLRGASHAEELVVHAKALGYSALAITDECSFAGAVRAHVAARQHGIKLIIGTEVQIDDGPRIVLLATNRESYGHISMLITRARMRADKGLYQVTLADLEHNLDHCLALLIPPRSAFLAPVAGSAPPHDTIPSPHLRGQGHTCSGAEGWGEGLRASPTLTPTLSRPKADEGVSLSIACLHHACHLARRFPQRAWIAAELHSGHIRMGLNFASSR